MKTRLRLLALLLALGAVSIPKAHAQTTLEFATTGSGPTGNGASVANQAITFRSNTNNPTGNTFATYTPTTTATFALSNQQFTLPTTRISTAVGVSFGATINTAGGTALADELFPTLDAYGASTAANYTSTNGVTGGIDVAANKGVEFFVSTESLPNTVPANARYYYADLTITFNRAIANPIIHVTGLGGIYGGGTGFSSELDLITSGVTLSKLSGSTELNVTSNQILNSASAPNAATGAGGASGSVLVSTPNAGVTSVSFRIYLRPNATGGDVNYSDNTGHAGDAWMLSLSTAAISPITGFVFEDVNYGGGDGRPRSVSGAVVRPNARVELYNASTGAFVSAVNTDASGQYTFNPVAGSYTVRVVNSTVTSSRPGAIAGLLPVQTYNGATDDVGGEVPTRVDAAANTTSANFSTLTSATNNTVAQSQVAVTVATGTTAVGADFGFNFSTVVNTNNSGQGSLRQFVTNSNTLTNAGLDQAAFNGTPATGVTAIDPAAGMEYAIFMLNDGRTTGTPLPGLRLGMTAPSGYSSTTKAFTFNVGAPFTITDSNTAIDGKVQTQLTGEGTTPTAAALAGEIILDLTSSGQGGFSITGGNTRIASLNIANAGVAAASRALNTTGAVIQDGVAIAFSGAGTTGSVVTDVTGQNNTIATVLLTNGATGVTLNNNSFRTGRSVASTGTTIAYDGAGVLLSNASGNIIRDNNISSNSGFGIELASGSNNNVISGNTLNANGFLNGTTATTTTTDDAGISITSGNNNLIQSNTISNNAGDGIVALNNTSGNRFMQNSIFSNGDMGIDLTAVSTETGDGLTKNADTKVATGANALLNFPVITQVGLNATTLSITGYAPSRSFIELFVADATTPTAGEGRIYLATVEENGTSDTDRKLGSYSGVVNGVDVGSQTNASAFFFSIPLASFTSDQLAALRFTDARITATATTLGTTTVGGTLVGNTSEFSGSAPLKAALPVTLTTFTAQANGLNTKLVWATSQELNNDRFVVERSFDAATFQKVGEVKGQGTTPTAHNYSFVDDNVGAKAQGTVYYRLRQVDLDGTATLSTVQTVHFTAATDVTVYPNPTSATTTTRLNLSALSTGTYQVTITDLAGRTVRVLSQQGGTAEVLALDNLPKGSYFLTIQGNGQTFTKRLIKE